MPQVVTRVRHSSFATDRQMTRALNELAGRCRIMARILKRTGPPPKRDFPAGFTGLCKIVVGQQLSAQSAAAIWRRVELDVVPFEPANLLFCDDDRLRSLGLSTGKVKTLRAIAAAVTTDGLDFDELNHASDLAIIERLTAIHGVGPWTADIYLLFALCRRDAFAPGDLALQFAAQHHFKLPARPTAAELEDLAERWRPLRAVAARLLWADYSYARQALASARRHAVTK